MCVFAIIKRCAVMWNGICGMVEMNEKSVVLNALTTDIRTHGTGLHAIPAPCHLDIHMRRIVTLITPLEFF